MDDRQHTGAPFAEPRGSRKRVRSASRGAVHSVVIGAVALLMHICVVVWGVRMYLADPNDPRFHVLDFIIFIALGLNVLGIVHALFAIRDAPQRNNTATFGLALNALGLLGMGVFYYLH